MPEIFLTRADRFTVLTPRLARISPRGKIKLLETRPLRLIEFGDSPPRLGVTLGGTVRPAMPANAGDWAVVIEHASLDCYPREFCPLAGWGDLARIYAPRGLSAPVLTLPDPSWRG